MQVLQELQKDDNTLIMEHIIFLLNRIWNNRNNVLHQGKSCTPEKEMQLIQQDHNFHIAISHKGKVKESGSKIPISKAQGNTPSSSTASNMDWIIIMDKYYHPIVKSCDVHIYYQNQLIIKLFFRKAPLPATSIWHRCLRAGLQWIVSNPFYTSRCSLCVFVDKSMSFYQLMSSTQDMVAIDIQQLLSAYVFLSFL